MNTAQIRDAASEARATAESYSAHEAPEVRMLCEVAVFHASRAWDRAPHDRLLALAHLEALEHAVSGVLEAVV